MASRRDEGVDLDARIVERDHEGISLDSCVLSANAEDAESHVEQVSFNISLREGPVTKD